MVIRLRNLCLRVFIDNLKMKTIEKSEFIHQMH